MQNNEGYYRASVRWSLTMPLQDPICITYPLAAYRRKPNACNQEKSLNRAPAPLPRHASPRVAIFSAWPHNRKLMLRSAASVASHSAPLHCFQFLLQLLDGGVGRFKVLVQSISLSDQLLLPLSKSLLFNLDLLGEALA
jgi:hypothetical protein